MGPATRRLVLLCYAPAALLLAAVVLAALIGGTAPSRLTRDPAVLLGAHPLVGVVSHAGALLWAATAAISLFTAALVRRSVERPEWLFLFGAGMLTSWLMLDDLFMFHDWLFPDVLGIRQKLVLAAYVGFTALFLARFAALILRTAYPVLGLALGCFALSVGIDLLPDAWFRWDYLYLIEDGAKLFGIVGWFAYFVSVAAHNIGSGRAAASAGPGHHPLQTEA